MKKHPSTTAGKSDDSESFPHPTFHTAGEKIVIYRIRKRVAEFKTRLIHAAVKAGKLPTGRQMAARVFNAAWREAFR